MSQSSEISLPHASSLNQCWSIPGRSPKDFAVISRGGRGLWAAMSVVIHRLPCPGVRYEYTPRQISRGPAGIVVQEAKNSEELFSIPERLSLVTSARSRPEDLLVVGGEVALALERLI